MTKVFVHGNPETAAVWAELVPALQRRGVNDLVLLSPPGFGAPVPTGFGATQAEYRDWLVRELEKIGGVIDLVGHDWGAGHVFGVAAHRPDLLRSWSADCCGLMDPDYVWHPAAQVWQTPGDGEASIAQVMSMTAEQYTSVFGVPARLAPLLAAGTNDVMGRCILALYRSAVQPRMRELGQKLVQANRVPALLIHPTGDHYVPPEMTLTLARRLGAEVLTLEGLAHWWMYEDADLAAEGFARFWAKLD
jgi:pimeloyl-ACP methyl ester carboxylesterase